MGGTRWGTFALLCCVYSWAQVDAICGDGNVERTEECDSGRQNGVGCTNACKLEGPEWQCFGSPSACTRGSEYAGTVGAALKSTGSTAPSAAAIEAFLGSANLSSASTTTISNTTLVALDLWETEFSIRLAAEDKGRVSEITKLLRKAGSDSVTFTLSFSNFTCGNGIVELGEECDAGFGANALGNFNSNSTKGCTQTCVVVFGFICAPNVVGGTPRQICTECGNGSPGGVEQCDDGNRVDGDGCSSSCLIEPNLPSPPPVAGTICGDGIRSPTEDCDDGNLLPGDGCFRCKVETGWTCAGSNPDRCSTSSSQACGNSVRDGDEMCDDGNVKDGDGCSSQCRVEDGFHCTRPGIHGGSVCVRPGAECGDGQVNSNRVDVDFSEQCDDHNTVSGDGCSSTCKQEDGWTCAGSPSICVNGTDPLTGTGELVAPSPSASSSDDNTAFLITLIIVVLCLACAGAIGMICIYRRKRVGKSAGGKGGRKNITSPSAIPLSSAHRNDELSIHHDTVLPEPEESVQRSEIEASKTRGEAAAASGSGGGASGGKRQATGDTKVEHSAVENCPYWITKDYPVGTETKLEQAGNEDSDIKVEFDHL